MRVDEYSVRFATFSTIRYPDDDVRQVDIGFVKSRVHHVEPGKMRVQVEKKRQVTKEPRSDAPVTPTPFLPPNLALELAALFLVQDLLAQSFDLLCFANHPYVRFCVFARARRAVPDFF